MMRISDRERGAALLVVMVAVAVLTALAVELAYDTRVSLRIAANARDELRATYLAKGGVGLSRLVLSFQKELDRSLARPPGQPSLPRPQLWRLVPIGSSLSSGLFGGPAAPTLAEPTEASAPDGFEAEIEDEGRKVNVQFEGLPNSAVLAAQVQAFYQLICDSKWDPLFDREDANGVRVPRQDLLVYLRDWVDPFEATSALSASFQPGGCAIVPSARPFEDGFGDENFPYDRGEDRYRTKNARMDSLDELYMIAGVGDAFMAAFGDAITVYMPRDEKWGVNETDPAGLLVRARFIADSWDDPALQNPLFLTRLHQFVLERTLGGLLSLTAWDLGQLVEAAGVRVNPNIVNPTSNANPFAEEPVAFRVRSSGRAGDVEKTFDVVLWFNEKPAPGQTVSQPGRIVHWREE